MASLKNIIQSAPMMRGALPIKAKSGNKITNKSYTMKIINKAQAGKKVVKKKTDHPNDDYKNMKDPATGKKGTMGGEGTNRGPNYKMLKAGGKMKKAKTGMKVAKCKTGCK